MPDDKRGREKQARDADRRQRERDVAAELERWHETEPTVDAEDLGDAEAGLEGVAFPTTGTEIVAEIGDRTLETPDGKRAVSELIPDLDDGKYDSADAVRARLQRLTVAATITRITEAADALPETDLTGSQRTAYERTFLELKNVDAVDADEGIAVVGDWILAAIREDERLPDSRGVRRRAADYCRDQGYQVGNNEWLGVRAGPGAPGGMRRLLRR